MTDNQNNIAEIAKKQRYTHLLNKIKSGKALNRSEIKELERYENMKNILNENEVNIKRRKPGGGRKSKYNEGMNKIVKSLTAKGCTDKQLAIFFGVDERTITNWKKQFPLFFLSLKTGKKMIDAEVEASLFQRAIGYSLPDVHISSYEGEITITPIVKHFPPDTTAQIFWLKNRKPKQWRDKQDINLSGEVNSNKIIPIMPEMTKEQWLQLMNQKPNKKSDKRI